MQQRSTTRGPFPTPVLPPAGGSFGSQPALSSVVGDEDNDHYDDSRMELEAMGHNLVREVSCEREDLFPVDPLPPPLQTSVLVNPRESALESLVDEFSLRQTQVHNLSPYRQTQAFAYTTTRARRRCSCRRCLRCRQHLPTWQACRRRSPRTGAWAAAAVAGAAAAATAAPTA